MCGKFQIFDDWISPSVIKIILVINLVMTIILSSILILGAVIVSVQTYVCFSQTLNHFTKFSEKSLLVFTVGHFGHYVVHWSSSRCYLHGCCFPS